MPALRVQIPQVIDQSDASRFVLAALALLLSDRFSALPVLMGVAAATEVVEPVVVAGTPGHGSAWSQLSHPHGLHAARDGTVYIADQANNRVLRWAPGALEGTVVAGGNGHGPGLQQLYTPEDILVDESEETGQPNLIYVADRDNHRVIRFTEGQPAGVVVAGSGGAGSANHQLHSPWCIDLVNGQLFVSDYYNHRIMAWAADATEGTLVAGGNGAGQGLHQLYYPHGLSVSILVSNGNASILVSDHNNHRVMLWEEGADAGTVVAGGNGQGSMLHQLYS